MKKPVFYYIWNSGFIIMGFLSTFLIGYLIWVSFFGTPCWAFDGGEFNNTITREIIERCRK